MGALEQIIQNEVDKKLVKSTLISTAPYRVIAILDNSFSRFNSFPLYLIVVNLSLINLSKLSSPPSFPTIDSP